MEMALRLVKINITTNDLLAKS